MTRIWMTNISSVEKGSGYHIRRGLGLLPNSSHDYWVSRSDEQYAVLHYRGIFARNVELVGIRQERGDALELAHNKAHSKAFSLRLKLIIPGKIIDNTNKGREDQSRLVAATEQPVPVGGGGG